MIFDKDLRAVEIRKGPTDSRAKAVMDRAREARRRASEISSRILASKAAFLEAFRHGCAFLSPGTAELAFEVATLNSYGSPVLTWTYKASLSVAGVSWTVFCERSMVAKSMRWATIVDPSAAWQPFGNGPTLGSMACVWCAAGPCGPGSCSPAVHLRPGVLDEWVKEVAMEIDEDLSGDVRRALERMEPETSQFEETEAFLSARKASATAFVRNCIDQMSGLVVVADRDSVVEAVDLAVARSVLES